MKKTRLATALLAMAAMTTMTGCAEAMLSGAYKMAVTSNTAGDCAGLKGKTLEDAESKLKLKPDTLDDLADGKQKAVFTKGYFEAEIVLDSSGKIESTMCGDADRLRKQRLLNRYGTRADGKPAIPFI
ncbi:MAG: hypothetical protein M0Z78_08875 [Betaproteobacteria bacterium]|nr:hypothetical protein [Betaproteobacteria bacterium]